MISNYTDFVGFILPPFIDILNRFVPESRLRFVIAMLFCIAIAVIFNFDQLNNAGFETVLAKASFIFAQAQLTYKIWYEKSQMREKIAGR